MHAEQTTCQACCKADKLHVWAINNFWVISNVGIFQVYWLRLSFVRALFIEILSSLQNVQPATKELHCLLQASRIAMQPLLGQLLFN